MRHVAGVGLLVLLTVGCSASESETALRDAASPMTESAAASAAPPIAPGGTITGVVREQIPVDPYIYLRLETADGGELWTAVADAPITVGEPITIYNALLMEQFASATLQRTFERLYFGALEPPGSDAYGAAGSSSGSSIPADARVGTIAPATGERARTIGDLWLQMDRLARTTVTVRGVVVKYNGGVMGKNWIHLQDGTGDPSIGTHDLAVTSLDVAAVGDTITVTGSVRTNVDVGAGYTYVLLLEDATVSGR
jgi:hypothetical protein